MRTVLKTRVKFQNNLHKHNLSKEILKDSIKFRLILKSWFLLKSGYCVICMIKQTIIINPNKYRITRRRFNIANDHIIALEWLYTELKWSVWRKTKKREIEAIYTKIRAVNYSAVPEKVATYQSYNRDLDFSCVVICLSDYMFNFMWAHRVYGRLLKIVRMY